MPEVAVAGVDLGTAGFDLDAMGLGVVEAVLARDEGPLAPWRDDLQLRCERLEGVLEADLIVTLAGAAMCESRRPLCEGNLNLMLCDNGAGNRSAQQILMFVDCPGANGREDVLLKELFPKIFDDDLLCAGCISLRNHRINV